MKNKNKTIRFFICFALVLSLCLGMTGCRLSDYQLVEIDGKHYLVFDDIFLYYRERDEDVCVFQVAPEVRFDSLKDFKNIVTCGVLTEEQKREVARFSKDKEYRVKICDFDNLYYPVTPDGSALTQEVTWVGDEYYFTYDLDDKQYVFISIHTDGSYQGIYEYRYVDAFKYSTIKARENDGNKEIIYYKNNSVTYKRVRCTLTEGDKVFHIDRKYHLNSKGVGEASPAIPMEITAYCEQDGQKYEIDVRNIKKDVSDEWLFQFGIQKYVDKK